VDLHSMWIALHAANRIAPALLRCLPILLLSVAFLGLRPPANPATAAWFAASILCAALLVAAWTTWITSTLFWTISGAGIARIGPVLTMAASGQLVPLAVFPDSMRSVLSWLPFAGMVDIPFSIWTGAAPPQEWGLLLSRQVGWTIVLILVGRWTLARGLRRLAVQGG